MKKKIWCWLWHKTSRLHFWVGRQAIKQCKRESEKQMRKLNLKYLEEKT